MKLNCVVEGLGFASLTIYIRKGVRKDILPGNHRQFEHFSMERVHGCLTQLLGRLSLGQLLYKSVCCSCHIKRNQLNMSSFPVYHNPHNHLIAA